MCLLYCKTKQLLLLKRRKSAEWVKRFHWEPLISWKFGNESAERRHCSEKLELKYSICASKNNRTHKNMAQSTMAAAEFAQWVNTEIKGIDNFRISRNISVIELLTACHSINSIFCAVNRLTYGFVMCKHNIDYFIQLASMIFTSFLTTQCFLLVLLGIT